MILGSKYWTLDFLWTTQYDRKCTFKAPSVLHNSWYARAGSSETFTTARPTRVVCALEISALYIVPLDQDGPLKKRFSTKIRLLRVGFLPKYATDCRLSLWSWKAHLWSTTPWKNQPWAVWKRLAAEVIFQSPNGIDIPSSGYHSLPLQLVWTVRSRLFRTENTLVIFSHSYLRVYVNKKRTNTSIGGEYETVGCVIHNFWYRRDRDMRLTPFDREKGATSNCVNIWLVNCWSIWWLL